VSARAPSSPPATDRAARVLELALGAFVLLAPLPFGAVGPRGRLALELGAGALLLLWSARALRHGTPLPSAVVRAGLVGLLALAALQALPLGSAAVALVSPRALELRVTSRPPEAALRAEADLLGISPSSLEPPAALSVDPGATASALRTGAAYAALFLVATTVAAVRGCRLLALALLLSAVFQGLYGLLVMASGHDRIWHLPKRYFLDSATGTFVNRNHFACLLAMCLASGLALMHDNARRARRGAPGTGLAASLTPERLRNALLGLLLAVGLAGLLLSFSRAGIALGLFALGLTALAAGRFERLGLRFVTALLVATAASVPLIQLGADRLVARFAEAPAELSGARTTVWLDALSLAAEFPVTGCGFGTFAAAYPLVRSGEVRQFFAHAHNDLLQVGVEGGVLGAGLLALVLVPVLGRVARSIAGAKGTLAVGLAAGLAAMLLHGLVDFNFHIPANGAVAAVLAGAIEGLPWTDGR
jgi:O-antigen ligase